MARDRSQGGFTPTEVRILNVLADGQPHPVAELMKCLDDELAERVNLQMHISRIRKKLAPVGQWIVCQVGEGPRSYRHIQKVSPATLASLLAMEPGPGTTPPR